MNQKMINYLFDKFPSKEQRSGGFPCWPICWEKPEEYKTEWQTWLAVGNNLPREKFTEHLDDMEVIGEFLSLYGDLSNFHISSERWLTPSEKARIMVSMYYREKAGEFVETDHKLSVGDCPK